MRWMCLLGYFAAWVAAPAFAVGPIRYTIDVETEAPVPSLVVDVQFDGDQDGVTEIELPSEWAGSEQLYRHLADMTVIGGALLASRDPARRSIRHAPGAPLRLHYRIVDGQPGLPAARSYEKARPVVEPDWFYVHGEGAFVIPAGREKAPARVRWGRRPPGWQVAGDLDVADQAVLTANDVARAILIGGKGLRITQRLVAGRPVVLAALGRWAYTDAQFADRLAALIAAENALLSAPATPYFVSLAPLTGAETGALSYGGSGRTSGFALAATDNVQLGDFARLLAHEYAHRWFGSAWGPFADGAADYWFTEGFADWFAARAMVRSGLWTLADWRDATNAMLLRYGGSTARGLTDAEVTAQFWTNQDAMQIQYDRGNLTATLIDGMLRQRGSTLMDVLARMAGSPPAAGEGGVQRLDALAGGLVAEARKRAGAATLPADMFGPCGPLQTMTQPAYDRGFKMTADNVVETVRAGSPAWAAGVRPGMRLVRRTTINWGDASKPYAAEFLDGTALRQLSWLPEGERQVRFQRLPETPVDAVACAALLQ